ncbi:MAG: type I restriction enzyme, R subunit [Alphaproteobacteria bacterium]|nr:MAG: type I restriction enzyme R subunit [Caulobacteraceae bacterium]TPW03370.1 MAG: type I restriction enzyme, R subunit [Alphaproteobacteria bacterium]
MRPIRPDQNIPRARKLRQSSNLPEQVAWRALRTLRDDGWTVRRQHLIGRLIVDFAIVTAKLVIEIDGSIHQRDDVQASDQMRDAFLESEGWRVLRLPAKVGLSEDALLSHVRLALRSYGPSP